MPSDLERELGEALHEPIAAPDLARRDALERELLAKLPAARTRASGWSKWLVGGGLGAALAVGACALPSDYSTRIGHRLAIVVDVAAADDVDPEALVHFVTEQYHPDELRMGVALERVREHGEAEHASMRIEIDAVGEDLDTDVIWEDLVEHFPELAQARLEDEELQGMVHGTLGGRLSQAWLDIVIDKGGVEEAKRQVIEQLRAQGVEGDAQVDIVDHTGEDGQRRREVRVMIQDDEHH
jgi:hypothetical protein